MTTTSDISNEARNVCPDALLRFGLERFASAESFCAEFAENSDKHTESETINKNSINIYGNKSSFATREFSRSVNTNIATATLPEVPGTQEDDVDTVYPGHQIPRKRLSSLYSYTVTSKIPNQRVSTKYVVILRETPGDDVDTANPWRRVPRGALPSLYSCSATSKIPDQRVSTKNETTLILITLGTRYF
ncbi:hypothetical protein TSAR_003188 [Trichomalopsis sarcophagae]|uniref:Uncharacterized protein n=1 Tax=Trichomalopsis sarcophagae TaxID=543379 RepID=A0A232FEV7_9HYME|nr:hypothetical protein TSAR_003188 [Trichomalopsis sarcophagae]